MKATKKPPLVYVPVAETPPSSITVNRSQSRRVRPRKTLFPTLSSIPREACIKDITANKKRTARTTPLITLRSEESQEESKYELRQIRRRREQPSPSGLGLQCRHCDVSVTFENAATLGRHVAEKHPRNANQPRFADLPTNGGAAPRTFNVKIAYRCRSNAERILGGSRDEALLKFRGYIAQSDRYAAVSLGKDER